MVVIVNKWGIKLNEINQAFRCSPFHTHPSQQDFKFSELCSTEGSAVVLVVNKWGFKLKEINQTF